MKAQSWLVLALLAGLVLTATGGTWDDQLGVDADQDYLRPRYFQPKAGVCLVFDDGYKSFLTKFVSASDSIYAESGVRIRGTTGIILTDVDAGTSTKLSWSDLSQFRDLDRQRDFEIALHGNSSERVGSQLAGFSSTFVDSMFTAWQNRLAAAGLPKARSFILPNHRYTAGLEEVYKANGIYQIGGLAIPVASDSATATKANEHSSMEVNNDSWPMAMAGETSSAYAAFQRHGGIFNRWNVGRRQSFNYDGADSLGPGESKKIINMAVQARSMAFLTFHDIGDSSATGLTITEADLLDVMDHIKTLVQAGVLETLTFEQAVARGTGKVYGELLPHYHFTRLQDLVDSTDVLVGAAGGAGFIQPLGWPLTQSGAFFNATNGTDTLTHSFAAADSAAWKVWPLTGRTVVDSINGLTADIDTVFNIYSGASLSDWLSYGAGKPTGNVLIAKGDSTTSVSVNPVTVIIPTTGVESRFVDVTIQAMVPNAASVNGYISARIVQFEEIWEDYVNDGAAAYDFTYGTGANSAFDVARLDLSRSRVRPLFSFAAIDTVIARAMGGLADTAGVGAGSWGDLAVVRNMITDTAGQATRWYYPRTRAYMLETQGTVDARSSFGVTTDITSATGAAEAITPNLSFFDAGYDTTRLGSANSPAAGFGGVYWVTYNYRVPIVPGETDFIHCSLTLKRATEWDVVPIIVVSDISATAGRG